jgi:hypothetical protein
MNVSNRQRLRAMEDEYRRLKKLVVGPSLYREALKALIRNTAGVCRLERRCGVRISQLRTERAASPQADRRASRQLPLRAASRSRSAHLAMSA